MSVNHVGARQKQCNFRCPTWMRDAIRTAAIELGLSDSEYIKSVLRADLRENHGITENTDLNTR